MPWEVATRRVSAGLRENNPLQTTPGISLIWLSKLLASFSFMVRPWVSIMRFALSVMNPSRQIGVYPRFLRCLPTRLLAEGMISIGRGNFPSVLTSLDSSIIQKNS